MRGLRSPERRLATFAAALVVSCLAGCRGVQSALDPAGPNAREIETLWWIMFGAAAVIFLLVLVSLLISIFGRAQLRRRISPMQLVVGGGIILPLIVLSIMVPFNVYVSSGVSDSRGEDTLTIRVRGHQWWWDIEYDFAGPTPGFYTANEIWLPVGEPVELILTSADVIHSLWFPKLAGKLDLIPGRRNRMMIEADVPGVSRGQCAEFCGLSHAKMALFAVAVPPDRFADWADRQREAAGDPGDPIGREGARLFATSGCPLCHTVRGHGSWGRAGPDLTHVGSRMTIGAGLLDNTRDNLAAWIAHNDALKRGNRMPDFTDIDPRTRTAIAAYLESLK